MDQQFLFIIGSLRSGTTWLQAMMGSHPQVCTTVELTLYDAYVIPWIKTWKNEVIARKGQPWIGVLPFLWSEAEFYDFLRDFLNKAYTKVLNLKPDATHILDKMPGNSCYTQEIKALIPNARFIHIIRDGRDVVASIAIRNEMWKMKRGEKERIKCPV